MIKPLLPVLLLFTAACSSGIPEKTDREEMELKGFVKSLKTKFYHVVEKDGKVVEGPLNSGLESDIVSFNRDGSITRKEYFYISQQKDASQTERMQSYFDASGKKLRDSLWSSYPDVFDGVYVYTYNSQDLLTDKSFFSRSGKRGIRERFHYHRNGTVSVRYVYMGGKRTVATFSKYDDNGNMIRATTFYAGTKGKLVQEQTYDSEDRGTEYKCTSFPGGMKSRFRYQYNEHGDLSAQLSLNENGVWKLMKQYTYVYDSRGNWTKSTELVKKEPVQITEREIIYY